MSLRLSLLLTFAMLACCSGRGGNSSEAVAPDSSQKSPPSGNKASPSNDADVGVVRDFVQEFYSWYVPVAANSRSGVPSDVALNTHLSAFDPSLARQLKEDSDAQ